MASGNNRWSSRALLAGVATVVLLLLLAREMVPRAMEKGGHTVVADEGSMSLAMRKGGGSSRLRDGEAAMAEGEEEEDSSETRSSRKSRRHSREEWSTDDDEEEGEKKGAVAASSSGNYMWDEWATFKTNWKRIDETESQIHVAMGRTGTNIFEREFGGVNKLQKSLYTLIAAKLRKGIICETGVLYGVSANAMHQASGGAIVESFDLEYREPSSTVLRTLLGSSLRTHQGEAATTVAAFQGTCNLIHIDGNHNDDGPWLDIINFRKNAACDHLILSDDTHETPDYETNTGYCQKDCNGCDCNRNGFINEGSVAWWRAVKEGIVEPAACFRLGSDGVFMKSFCVGRYVKPGKCT